MKRIFLLLFLLGLFTGPAVPLHAQLSVELRISQLNYLLYEAIFARVFIRNISGHAIAFGERNELQGSLRFEIQTHENVGKRYLPLIDPALTPPLTGSIIPAGATREYTFNLRDYYDIRATGRYGIRAVVRHNRFRDEYLSPLVSFNVVNGMLFRKIPVGVPSFEEDITGKNSSGTKIQQRCYHILSYFTGKIHVYNLMIDDDQVVYANRRIGFNLGPTLSPECEVDFLSRLNLLMPANAKVFAYYRFTPDGRLDQRRILLKTASRPRLVVDTKTGSVSVIGGREARRDLDYEEIKDIPFVGIRSGSKPPPPKGSITKDLDAVR